LRLIVISHNRGNRICKATIETPISKERRKEIKKSNSTNILSHRSIANLTSNINFLAAGLLGGRLGAEITLFLAAIVEHTIEGVGVRKSFTDTFEILLSHGTVPVALHAATSRIVCKANKRTILVCIKLCRVVQLTYTALIAGDVFSKQLLAFGLRDGCIDATAVAIGGTVVAVTFVPLALSLRFQQSSGNLPIAWWPTVSV
jgi:hypothetical protein